ncbi:hypothetical protein AB6G49_02770 [Staphylococcus haemolyticus]|uniref:hypothetical protein n=1 Tax=Staphylococcus haemolyticus TaxID=1283 RepID=UPI000F871817|nr:hypothetical protein [Staphylococcus haemolyticus]MCH4351761.1 hypothetical protein [Staphylococcus haemolyticus]MCH4388448.1 hypothetical protein [Staphylococcus haemolyticus]MCH4483976.1 hypothetical protein [Staphylococcus haemolyticus]MCI2934627.1 hypothetical protein [Staphylococcus haemolyticus]MEB7320914.1 hypothetical protein [Staphylococcus haemolyticus]
MFKSKLLSIILTSLITIISVTIGIYLFLVRDSLEIGYQNLYLLPISYAICYLLFIRVVVKNYGISLFLGVYLTVSFFRYVILSLLVVKSQWFLGRSEFPPDFNLFNKAIFLMAYELLAYSIAILVFHKIFFKNRHKENIYSEKNKDYNIQFSNSNIVYILFIILTGLLVVLRPGSLNFFSFFSVNSSYTSIDEADGLTSIVIIFLNISRLLIYFMIIRWIYTKIHPKNMLLSFSLISFITVINALIFFGTNRSDFIFNFIINLIILIYLYKKSGITLNVFLILLLPIVVSGMTKYRESVTVTNGANKLVDITDNLQVYLGGVYNVAMSLDLTSPTNNPLMLLADIFRSAIGPNLILKNLNLVSSVKLFNFRIYQNDHISQIIPMIGQANLYLGFIFAPLLGMFFIGLAIFLVREIIKFRRFELIYVFTLFSGRLGFVMGQNGNILLNDLTFFLPLFLLVFYINNKVVIKK